MNLLNCQTTMYMAHIWLLDKNDNRKLITVQHFKSVTRQKSQAVIMTLGYKHKFILTGLHHLIHRNREYSSSLYSPKLSLYYQLTLLPVVLSWGQMSLPWWGSCEPSMTWAVSSPTNHIAWSVDSLIQSPETVGIVINYYSTVSTVVYMSTSIFIHHTFLMGKTFVGEV